MTNRIFFYQTCLSKLYIAIFFLQQNKLIDMIKEEGKKEKMFFLVMRKL